MRDLSIHFRADTRHVDFAEMTAAMFILAFGVVLSVKACLGTTPVASFPTCSPWARA